MYKAFMTKIFGIIDKKIIIVRKKYVSPCNKVLYKANLLTGGPYFYLYDTDFDIPDNQEVLKILYEKDLKKIA
jgi:hypothetical protein